MSVTKVSIISNAIAMLGHRPIITLDDEDADDMVVSAEQAFDFLLPSSLASVGWRFATRISQLNVVNNETPPAKWQYVYQLPSGYLKNIRIYPQNYNYEIYENLKIYSDWAPSVPTFMEHIFQPDVSRLPPWFNHYFILELAAYLALSNAQKAEFYNPIESKRVDQMAIAMGIDAQNRPNFSQANFPVINITRDNAYDGVVD